MGVYPFLMMVQGDPSRNALVHRLMGFFPGSEQRSYRSFETSVAVMEIADNDEFDASRLDDPEEGYRFFQFELMVVPKTGSISESELEPFAMSIGHRLVEAGYRVEHCTFGGDVR